MDATRYLAEYYSARLPEQDPGSAWLIDCFVKSYSLCRAGISVLEFGGGPALYSAIAAAARASEIHWCDASPSALLEVENWIGNKQGAFSWDNFTRQILRAEGKEEVPMEVVVGRENRVRGILTAVFECDAFAEDPLLGCGMKSYDVVSNNGCLDSITDSRKTWEMLNTRIASLVGQAGWFLTAATLNGTSWRVGAEVFPAVDIELSDVLDLYHRLGFAVKLSDVQRLDRDGYQGMLFVAGQKRTSQ